MQTGKIKCNILHATCTLCDSVRSYANFLYLFYSKTLIIKDNVHWRPWNILQGKLKGLQSICLRKGKCKNWSERKEMHYLIILKPFVCLGMTIWFMSLCSQRKKKIFHYGVQFLFHVFIMLLAYMQQKREASYNGCSPLKKYIIYKITWNKFRPRNLESHSVCAIVFQSITTTWWNTTQNHIISSKEWYALCTFRVSWTFQCKLQSPCSVYMWGPLLSKTFKQWCCSLFQLPSILCCLYSIIHHLVKLS